MGIQDENYISHYPAGLTAPAFVDDRAVEKTADYTIVDLTDSGKTFFVQAADLTFQLPAIAIGNIFTIVNLAPDGSLLTIAPNANDGILYLGALDDDKDLINTAATAKRGDSVVLAALNSTVFWTVVSARGIWAKEA